MPRVDALVECPVYSSFRVQQVAGMFDVPLAAKARASFSVEVPGVDEDWSIGLIVGPSGSGKSTIARKAFGDDLYAGGDWPADKAVIDCFPPAMSAKDITHTLTAVGFSSPPSWVKPYTVLSNGERFRCDLARGLSGEAPLLVFDEFTSVVDRTVAKVGSAAVAKAIRSGKIKRRFVAVSCHYDIAEWLEPDWVVDMSTQTLARGRLRRPEIRLEVFRCHHSAWRLFSRHHYLSSDLNKAARCYLGTIDGQPVSFCAALPLIGKRGRYRLSRTVVLPDYQGLSIGSKTSDSVAGIIMGEGYRVNATASHPSLVAYRNKSPLWRAINVSKVGHATRGGSGLVKREGNNQWKPSFGRSVVSFEYVGPPVGSPGTPEPASVRPRRSGSPERSSRVRTVAGSVG